MASPGFGTAPFRSSWLYRSRGRPIGREVMMHRSKEGRTLWDNVLWLSTTSVQIYTVVASGGALAGGSSSLNTVCTVSSSGGALVGGASPLILVCSCTASGGALAGGSAFIETYIYGAVITPPEEEPSPVKAAFPIYMVGDRVRAEHKKRAKPFTITRAPYRR